MLGMASMPQAWLLLSCLSLQAYAQSLPTTVLLQLGAVPASLEASIVASSTDSGIDKDRVVTYELNCASAVSPENDACRALNLYPAHAYHTQGSIWGGTITVRADEVTTTWRCELGDCRKTCTGGATGICTQTIVGGGTTATETTVLDHCYVKQHSVPLIITAGVEKLDPSDYKLSVGASQLLSAWSSDLSSMGCPTRLALTAGTISSTTTLGSSSATSTSTTTTGPTLTSSQTAATASSAGVGGASSSTTPGSAVSTTIGNSWALVLSAMFLSIWLI